MGMFTNLKMAVKGYEKVSLKDTKGVLNKTNNFKWRKCQPGKVTTKFQTGTTVYRSGNTKHVVRTDGTEFVKISNNDGSYKLYKASKGGERQLIKEKNLKEVLQEKAKLAQELAKLAQEQANLAAENLNKKRQAFIDKFNANFQRTTIKGEDGTVTKMIHNKITGKLEHWFRKDGKTGNKSVGDIINYPNNLGKEVYVETPKKAITKTVANFQDLLGLGKHSLKTVVEK